MPADATAGTTVEVRDLFFNTPARAKFLKSPATEQTAIVRVVTQLALANPGVHVRLIANGRVLLNAPAGRRPPGAGRRAVRLRARRRGSSTCRARAAGARVDRRGRAAGARPHPPRRHPPDRQRPGGARHAPDPGAARGVPAAPAARPVPAGRPRARAWTRARSTSTSIPPRRGSGSAARGCSTALVLDAVRTALRQMDAAPAGLVARIAGDEAGPGGAAHAGARARRPARRLARLGGGRPGAGLALPRGRGGLSERAVLRAGGRPDRGHLHRGAHRRRGLLRRPARRARARALRAPARRARARRAGVAGAPVPAAARAGARHASGPSSACSPELARLGFALEGFGGGAILLRAVPSLLRTDDLPRLADELSRELDEDAGRGSSPVLDRLLAFVACRAAIKAHQPLAPEEMAQRPDGPGGDRHALLLPARTADRLADPARRDQARAPPDLVTRVSPGAGGRAPPVPLLAILGPTGVGKTRLAVALGEHWPIEVVSVDSRQVYRRMDIGTAKPTPEERRAVRHHLVDVVEPDERYDAARFAREAAGGDRGRARAAGGGRSWSAAPASTTARWCGGSCRGLRRTRRSGPRSGPRPATAGPEALHRRLQAPRPGRRRPASSARRAPREPRPRGGAPDRAARRSGAARAPGRRRPAGRGTGWWRSASRRPAPALYARAGRAGGPDARRRASWTRCGRSSTPGSPRRCRRCRGSATGTWSPVVRGRGRARGGAWRR